MKSKSPRRLGAPEITLFREDARALQFTAPAGAYVRFQTLADGQWHTMPGARVAWCTTAAGLELEASAAGVTLLAELFDFQARQYSQAAEDLASLLHNETFLVTGRALLTSGFPK